MNDEIFKQFGFESMAEFHRMVANVDISDGYKLAVFKNWQFHDGSKVGLQDLPTIKKENNDA